MQLYLSPFHDVLATAPDKENAGRLIPPFIDIGKGYQRDAIRIFCEQENQEVVLQESGWVGRAKQLFKRNWSVEDKIRNDFAIQNLIVVKEFRKMD